MSTIPSSNPGGTVSGSLPAAGARRIRHPLAAAGVPYAPAFTDVLQEPTILSQPRVQVRTLSSAASPLPGALAPEACEVVIEPHVPVQLAQTLGSLRRGAQDLSYRALSRADGAERIWVTARTPFHEFPTVLYAERLAQPAELPESIPSLFRVLMRPVRIRIWVSYSAADQQMQARADLQALAQEMTYWLGLHDPAEQFGALPSFASLPPRIQQARRQNPGSASAPRGNWTGRCSTPLWSSASPRLKRSEPWAGFCESTAPRPFDRVGASARRHARLPDRPDPGDDSYLGLASGGCGQKPLRCRVRLRAFG